MPRATHDGVGLHYEIDGRGETVAFVGDVGFGAWQWGWQHAAVAGGRAALVTDLRGTGRSDAPDGPYDVGTLAADLEAVLGDAGVRRTHLVGAGLGGMVALAYARRYDRARSLALLGTAASGDRIDEAVLRELAVPVDDPEALRTSLAAVLSPAFREAQPDVVEGIAEWRRTEDAEREAWTAQAAACLGFQAGPLYEVTLPALVVHGGEDRVVPPEAGAALADDLPRGTFRSLEGAGHLVGVERSRPVNDALVGFLDRAGEDAE